MAISVLVGAMALENFAGTIVVIANSPEGQVIHYLLGRFGSNYGGRQYPISAVPSSIRVIVVAPYMDKTFADWFSNPEEVTLTQDWDSAMDILKESHGPGTRVAVVPNATMQYYDSQ
jgi:hypothetical protein